jgi:hypothetical protein
MVKDNPDARNDFLAALKTIKRIEDFAIESVKNPTETFDEVAAKVGGSPFELQTEGDHFQKYYKDAYNYFRDLAQWQRTGVMNTLGAVGNEFFSLGE